MPTITTRTSKPIGLLKSAPSKGQLSACGYLAQSFYHIGVTPIRPAFKTATPEWPLAVDKLECVPNTQINDIDIRICLDMLAQWRAAALATSPEGIKALFSPFGTFTGTLADRTAIINTGREPDELNYYMERFLPGLKEILFRNVVIKKTGASSFRITGTYEFFREDRSTKGHFTYDIKQVDGKWLFDHHHSGVRAAKDVGIRYPEDTENERA